MNQFDVSFLDVYCEMDIDKDVKHNTDCEDSDCEGDCRDGSSERKVDDSGFDMESKFYETGLSKVSKFLAFDLMPKLKVRTVRTHKRLVTLRNLNAI